MQIKALRDHLVMPNIARYEVFDLARARMFPQCQVSNLVGRDTTEE